MYERMPGWSSPTRGVTRFEDLPEEARRYVRRLEEVTGVDCAIISTGSDRAETILETGSDRRTLAGSEVIGRGGFRESCSVR